MSTRLRIWKFLRLARLSVHGFTNYQCYLGYPIYLDFKFEVDSCDLDLRPRIGLTCSLMRS